MDRLRRSFAIILIGGRHYCFRTGIKAFLYRASDVVNVNKHIRGRRLPFAATIRKHDRAAIDIYLAMADLAVSFPFVSQLGVKHFLGKIDEFAGILHHKIWHDGLMPFRYFHKFLLLIDRVYLGGKSNNWKNTTKSGFQIFAAFCLAGKIDLRVVTGELAEIANEMRLVIVTTIEGNIGQRLFLPYSFNAAWKRMIREYIFGEKPANSLNFLSNCRSEKK
jgi:hypothetical protein